MRTLLAIRHFPDKKRPCLVLEQGNQCVILGYLTDRKALKKVINNNAEALSKLSKEVETLQKER